MTLWEPKAIFKSFVEMPSSTTTVNELTGVVVTG